MSEKLPKRWAINGCKEDFAFVCPKTWGKLKKGDDPNVRFCDECKKNVHLVKTREELEAKRAERCCVAAQDRSGGRTIGVLMPPGYVGNPDEYWKGILEQNPFPKDYQGKWKIKYTDKNE